MIATLRNVQRLHALVERSVCTTVGTLDYDRTRQASIRLLNCIRDYDGDGEDIWWIGEGSHCHVSDLIAALFWHSIDYIDGKCTDSLVLNSAANDIYSPGMTDGPEPGTGEIEAYTWLNRMADTYYNLDTTN